MIGLFSSFVPFSTDSSGYGWLKLSVLCFFNWDRFLKFGLSPHLFITSSNVRVSWIMQSDASASLECIALSSIQTFLIGMNCGVKIFWISTTSSYFTSYSQSDSAAGL